MAAIPGRQPQKDHVRVQKSLNTHTEKILKKIEKQREQDKELMHMEFLCEDILSSEFNEGPFIEFEMEELLGILLYGNQIISTELKLTYGYRDMYCTEELDSTFFSKVMLESFLDIDLMTSGYPSAGSSQYFNILKQSLIFGRLEYLEKISAINLNAYGKCLAEYKSNQEEL